MLQHSPTSPALAQAPFRPARTNGSAGLGKFFHHHGWLSPGIRLFRSIGFPAKAGWVAAAFMVPLVVLLYFWLALIQGQIDTTHSERDGVRYARPLLELIPLAQSRRRAFATGAADAAELQAKVKTAFEAVAAQHSALGKAMDLEEPYAALRQAHDALLLAPTAASGDETFLAHTNYVQAATLLLREVADGSQLTLDPEADTYHLQNIALVRGPRATENLARLRGMGTMVLGAKDTKELGSQRRDLMGRWLSVQGYIEEDVVNSFAAVIAATPEVDKLVNMKEAHAAGLAFTQAVNQQILGAQLEGDAASFLALGNVAVDKAAQVNAKLLNRLDERLAARIGRLHQEMWEKVGMALFFVALATYLMLAFYRVVMGGLREVSSHLKEITLGNLNTSPVPWGKDEAAQLMVTMGHMQDSLRRIVGVVLQSSSQVQVASQEIASASSDLSGRTEQTAASLEETAASMEQIASTVKQTAETVDGAMAIVRDNASVATRGGEVMSQVVSTMERIHGSS